MFQFFISTHFSQILQYSVSIEHIHLPFSDYVSNNTTGVVVIPRMSGSRQDGSGNGAGPDHASHSTWNASLHVSLSLW